jgi:hypothetical protein
MVLAIDILTISAFVAFPFAALCWVWFCKLNPQRLVMAALVTIAVNIVFGFVLMPAFTKPTQGFQWAAFVTSCVPPVWAIALIAKPRNRDERVSGFLGLSGLLWPVMVIDCAY